MSAARSAFVSYSREDSEFALRLTQDLKAAGANVWLDQVDIKPGTSWDNAIEDALLEAPQMLVVLSPTSVRSENVRDEISYALRQGKTVVPVLYMECIIPLRLERKQQIDFRADYARGLKALLEHLNVVRPDPAVLEKAAEGDAQRHAAWQARDAEAARLQEIRENTAHEEQRRAQEEAVLAAEARGKQAAMREAEEQAALRAREAQRLKEIAERERSEETEHAAAEQVRLWHQAAARPAQPSAIPIAPPEPKPKQLAADDPSPRYTIIALAVAALATVAYSLLDRLVPAFTHSPVGSMFRYICDIAATGAGVLLFGSRRPRWQAVVAAAAVEAGSLISRAVLGQLFFNWFDLSFLLWSGAICLLGSFALRKVTVQRLSACVIALPFMWFLFQWFGIRAQYHDFSPNISLIGYLLDVIVTALTVGAFFGLPVLLARRANKANPV